VAPCLVDSTGGHVAVGLTECRELRRAAGQHRTKAENEYQSDLHHRWRAIERINRAAWAAWAFISSPVAGAAK
jgi:hypothetical protein